MKTCVLPFSRRNGFEWRIRSRSRWNGVRRRQSSSERSLPRVSYERTARGDNQRSSCSRTWSSNASATLPANSVIDVRLDDDRDGSAVCAPSGACHVGGALRAEKSDHGGDLYGLAQPAQRAPCSNGFQDF